MYKRLPSARWDEKNKRWVLSVMISGRRKQFTSGKKTGGKKEVTEKAAAWLDSQDTEEKTNKRLSEVWALYLSDYVARKGENEQVIKLRSLGRVFILPALGDRRVGSLTIEDWQRVINDAKPSKNKRTLSKKYLNNLKGAIVNFCRWAVPRDYMTKDPAPHLYVPNNAHEVGRVILQVDDVAKLFAFRTGLWYERALLLELLTGLRPGEVLGLKRTDYKDGVLSISRAINSRGIVTGGKNKNAARVLVLPEEVRALVVEQLEATKPLRSVWLFPNTIGAQPSQVQYRRCWARIAAAHGLPSAVTPYSLRHTFFTHTEAHLPDRMIKAVFGHSAATDSHKLYGEHEIDGEAVEAARRLSVTPLYEAAKNAQN